MSDQTKTDPPTPAETPQAKSDAPDTEPLHGLDGVTPAFASPPVPNVPDASTEPEPEPEPGLALVIHRAELVAADVCAPGLAEHDARAARQFAAGLGNGVDTFFPSGWTLEHAQEVYARPPHAGTDGPSQLAWLESRGFVPRLGWPERDARDESRRWDVLERVARAYPALAHRCRVLANSAP